MAEIVQSFCRFCHAFCGIDVTVEAGRVTKVVGDVANPLYRGFSCIKGRARRLREAKARGMRLIVIDPRLTEAAANADLHLQPRPGEDPTILAGLLRVILGEGWYDRDFVEDEVEGLAELRAAVDPFTPGYVEVRAGVPSEQVVEAARMFLAGRARRSGATARRRPGTPSPTPNGHLAWSNRPRAAR